MQSITGDPSELVLGDGCEARRGAAHPYTPLECEVGEGLPIHQPHRHAPVGGGSCWGPITDDHVGEFDGGRVNEIYCFRCRGDKGSNVQIVVGCQEDKHKPIWSQLEVLGGGGGPKTRDFVLPYR